MEGLDGSNFGMCDVMYKGGELDASFDPLCRPSIEKCDGRIVPVLLHVCIWTYSALSGDEAA